MRLLNRNIVIGVAFLAGIIVSEGAVLCQEVARPEAAGQTAVQKDDKDVEAVDRVQDQVSKPRNVNQEDKQKNQVKKIQNSRPDLSKRRSARPPSINRPSGSGMPKGAGKPAGVSKPGRR